ncbi:uncharacterized protein C8Q71DRAFT_863337 [Rhodofomes roseus]|uniref:Uncharacterized protein n=1 Tax=Rhodofomes roseus TaxID=34475 RepID=A0ABQ8JYV9_9APHY|nr:uncharacterized protein C8Q71DRAFT_863337 [Rhodofomes roseus]KAH9829410.1 hypothetical protein C8Q71DRAFT_863337 [Rhodofomes roseus]
MASSSSKRHKRRATSPINTESLVDELIAHHPKRQRYSAKAPAPKGPKASFKTARLETNAGLKQKGKGVAKSSGSSKAKAQLPASGSATAGQKALSSSSAKSVAKPYPIGRVLLLPHGLNNEGEIRINKLSASDMKMFKRCGLAKSGAPDGGELFIKPNTDWFDVDDLLKSLFPAYYDWLKAEGTYEETTHHWKLVEKTGRRLAVVFLDDMKPLSFVDLCTAVHNRNGSWIERTWCFVTPRPVPTKVWKSWCRPQDVAPNVPVVEDGDEEEAKASATSEPESEGSDAGSELGSDAGSELGDDDNTATESASEWGDDEPLSQLKSSRKLKRAVDNMESSFSSFTLKEPRASTSAAGSGVASGSTSSAATGTLQGPIEISSSDEDPGNTLGEPPFTQQSPSPVQATRITRSATATQPQVLITRDVIAGDPWA